MVLGAMIIGSAVVGGVVVGHYTARRQFESMSARQAGQAQLEQTQAQAEARAAQAEARAAQAEAQAAQAGQAQASKEGKKDLIQQLEGLAKLKQQGILTEEEFQKMKMQLLLRD